MDREALLLPLGEQAFYQASNPFSRSPWVKGLLGIFLFGNLGFIVFSFLKSTSSPLAGVSLVLLWLVVAGRYVWEQILGRTIWPKKKLPHIQISASGIRYKPGLREPAADFPWKEIAGVGLVGNTLTVETLAGEQHAIPLNACLYKDVQQIKACLEHYRREQAPPLPVY